MKVDSSVVVLQAKSQQKQSMKVTSAQITTQQRGSAALMSADDIQDIIGVLDDCDSRGAPKNNGRLPDSVKNVAGRQKDDRGVVVDITDKAARYQKARQKEIEQENKARQRQNMSAQLRDMQKTGNTGFSPFNAVNNIFDLKFNLMRQMMEAIMGKGFADKLFTAVPHFSGFGNNGGNIGSISGGAQSGVGPVGDASFVGNAGGGEQLVYQTEINYDSAEFSMEQSYSFDARAIVRTADGREIDLSLQLNMSSAVYSKVEHLSARTEIFKDPLVINFNAASAELTETKMTFDLDADGSSYQISMLQQGSGFLALDTYGDGTVHDGSQLFGTKSGDGFADLAKYNSDGNDWIDENDEIFDKLRIWYTDESGKQQLMGLGEMGIGAIYLGNVKADYNLYSSAGAADSLQGVIRSTGIFLHENGQVGTMQHVDLRL